MFNLMYNNTYKKGRKLNHGAYYIVNDSVFIVQIQMIWLGCGGKMKQEEKNEEE